MHFPSLSTLSSVVASAPKPPLSLLRLGMATTPVGAGLAVASVVAVGVVANHEKIGSTLGKLENTAKDVGAKAITTTEKAVGITPKSIAETKAEEESSSSMMIPLLAVGGLAVVYFVMKKR